MPSWASFRSAFRPRRSAQRRYMRRSISAQSWASVPPSPALIVTTASPASCSPEKRRASSRPARVSSARSIPSASSPSMPGSRSPPRSSSRSRSAISASPSISSARARYWLRRPLAAACVGRDARRRGLVVPEAGRAHLPLELRDALLERRRVEVLAERPGPLAEGGGARDQLVEREGGVGAHRPGRPRARRRGTSCTSCRSRRGRGRCGRPCPRRTAPAARPPRPAGRAAPRLSS